MWWKEYSDYRYDTTMKRQQVETGKGIIGCEMHDIQGYSTTYHRSRFHRKGGVLTGIASYLFGFGKKKKAMVSKDD